MADLSNDVRFELDAAGKEIDNGEQGYGMRAVLFGVAKALCYSLAEIRDAVRGVDEMLGRIEDQRRERT